MPVTASSAIVTSLAAKTGLSAAVAAFTINTALTVGLTYASSALAQKGLKKQGLAPRDAVVRGGDYPKIVVYGETVVGGVMAYINQRDIGNDDFELWVALVHAGHEVEEILGVYYEDEFLAYGINIDPGGGDVVDSDNWTAVSSGGTYAARCKRFDGTQTAADIEFQGAFDDIGANFILQGYAYTLHRWTLWQGSEEIFKGGEPSNIRARVRGKRLYDPRLGADPNNPAFQAWSDNPILIAADYMLRYMHIRAERFDWDWIGAQATFCEEPVFIPGGTEARYRCNGAVSLGDTHNDNLKKILATCLGHRATVSGKIRITAGYDTTPTVALNESNILFLADGSSINNTVRTAVPREERYNRVTGTYTAESADYVSTEFQPQRDAQLVSRDNGEEIDRQIQLEMVTGEFTAQRLAQYHLQKAREEVSVELSLNWPALRAVAGGFVSMTYDKFGWAAKPFRVESLAIGERGVPITAALKEENGWTDPTAYVETLPDGSVTKPPETTPSISLLTAVGNTGSIEVDWVNPSRSQTWDYVEVYASQDSSWANAQLVADRVTAGQFVHTGGNTFDPILPNDTRYYWARGVRNGVESLRTPNSDVSGVSATAKEFPSQETERNFPLGVFQTGTLTSNQWVNIGPNVIVIIGPNGQLNYSAGGVLDASALNVPVIAVGDCQLRKQDEFGGTNDVLVATLTATVDPGTGDITISDQLNVEVMPSGQERYRYYVRIRNTGPTSNYNALTFGHALQWVA